MENTMEKVLSINLITTNPNVRGGRPCIAGTGIRVTDIIAATTFRRRTPEEVAVDHDLSLAQVYAALSFYHDNKEEVDQDLREQIADAKAYREAFIKNGGRSLLSR